MYFDVLIDLLDFMQMGIGLAVRLYQSIAAEVSVVRLISKITAIGPEPGLFRFLLNSLCRGEIYPENSVGIRAACGRLRRSAGRTVL